jgi:hypothetical protein
MSLEMISPFVQNCKNILSLKNVPVSKIFVTSLEQHRHNGCAIFWDESHSAATEMYRDRFYKLEFFLRLLLVELKITWIHDSNSG